MRGGRSRAGIVIKADPGEEEEEEEKEEEEFVEIIVASMKEVTGGLVTVVVELWRRQIGK